MRVLLRPVSGPADRNSMDDSFRSRYRIHFWTKLVEVINCHGCGVWRAECNTTHDLQSTISSLSSPTPTLYPVRQQSSMSTSSPPPHRSTPLPPSYPATNVQPGIAHPPVNPQRRPTFQPGPHTHTHTQAKPPYRQSSEQRPSASLPEIRLDMGRGGRLGARRRRK